MMIVFLFIFQVSSLQSIISVGMIKEHKVSRSVYLKMLNAGYTIKSVLLYIFPFLRNILILLCNKYPSEETGNKVCISLNKKAFR